MNQFRCRISKWYILSFAKNSLRLSVKSKINRTTVGLCGESTRPFLSLFSGSEMLKLLWTGVPEACINTMDNQLYFTDIVGCSYLSMPQVSASGTEVLLYILFHNQVQQLTRRNHTMLMWSGTVQPPGWSNNKPSAQKVRHRADIGPTANGGHEQRWLTGSGFTEAPCPRVGGFWDSTN